MIKSKSCNLSQVVKFNFMYYKDFWILKLKKNGGVIWEKTYGGPYMEKADDIVTLDDGGYAVIGDKCDHEYNLESCGPGL